MKNLFKEAHEMTREIKAEYPEVEYQAQFGLCLSYLHKKGGVTMYNLKGSEKQIEWATAILNDINSVLGDIEASSASIHNNKNQKAINQRVTYVKTMLDKIDYAGDIIDKFKKVSYADNKTATVLSLIQYHTVSARLVNGIRFGSAINEHLQAKQNPSDKKTAEFVKFGRDIKVERQGKELIITIDGIKGTASIETKAQSKNGAYNYIVTDTKVINGIEADTEKLVITHDSAEEMYRAII